MKRAGLLLAVALGAVTALASLASCSSDPASAVPAPAPASEAGVTDAGAAFDTGAVTLNVPVRGRVYVSLAAPAIVTPASPATDTTWDLAFEGADVFTNSGASGSGKAGAFGPLDAIAFLSDTAPDVPFLTSDQSGGAFFGWYFYDDGTHQLYSRYHVLGVKDGAKTYRVQVLSYYGGNGGTTSALYRIRYGEVGQPAMDAVDLDGTPNDPAAPFECIDLGSGARTKLTAVAARASSAWHLCFARTNISVNGGSAGPRGATAVDLEAAKDATEQLADVKGRTPESTAAAFDAANAASFAGATFLADGAYSAFRGLWTVPGTNPLAPEDAAWLVEGASGKAAYLVGFESFAGATATTVGTVTMRIKSVH